MRAKQCAEWLVLSRSLRLALTASTSAGRRRAGGSSGQLVGGRGHHLSAGFVCVQPAPLRTPQSHSPDACPRAAAFEVQPPPEGTSAVGAVAAGSAGPNWADEGAPGRRGEGGRRRRPGRSGAGSFCFPVNKAPGRGRPYKCSCGGAG